MTLTPTAVHPELSARRRTRRGPAKAPSGRRRSGRSRPLLVASALLALLVALLAALLSDRRQGSPGTSGTPGSPEALARRGPAPAVPELRVEVLASYPHDPGAYTQGLLWHAGHLYESTGLNGRSSLRRVALATGEVLARRDLPRELFGEGLERVGDQLYQLTWLSGLGQIWNLETFERTGQFFYEGQGWGLCFDGRHLVMSDGSDELSLRDPSTFREIARRPVRAGGARVRDLNELECVGGEIYANLYGSDRVARIDAASGAVTAWIDASGLLTEAERAEAEVLNGIAYRPEEGTFLLTGKLWPKVFEVKFVEPAARAREEDS